MYDNKKNFVFSLIGRGHSIPASQSSPKWKPVAKITDDASKKLPLARTGLSSEISALPDGQTTTNLQEHSSMEQILQIIQTLAQEKAALLEPGLFVMNQIRKPSNLRRA